MNRGENIFDQLEQHAVPYHVSDWHAGEEDNLRACEEDIRKGDIRFAFLYMAAMDGLLHQVGKHSPLVDEKLAWYETRLRNLFHVAREHYDELRLFICSDHGMATVERHVDLMADIAVLPLSFGQDYVAVYDSTMARFWFPNPAAREVVEQALSRQDCGRMLSAAELADLGCDFDNDQFGELIFLLDAGGIIVPSHMGLKPITGMHGYHPDHPDSDASLLANVELPVAVDDITDIFRLMLAEIARDARPARLAAAA